MSSDKFDMYTTVEATCSTPNDGSTSIEPSACAVPVGIRAVISVAALTMSIWPHAMLYLRPSSEVELVRLVTACLVAATRRKREAYEEGHS